MYTLLLHVQPWLQLRPSTQSRSSASSNQWHFTLIKSKYCCVIQGKRCLLDMFLFVVFSCGLFHLIIHIIIRTFHPILTRIHFQCSLHLDAKKIFLTISHSPSICSAHKRYFEWQSVNWAALFRFYCDTRRAKSWKESGKSKKKWFLLTNRIHHRKTNLIIRKIFGWFGVRDRFAFETLSAQFVLILMVETRPWIIGCRTVNAITLEKYRSSPNIDFFFIFAEPKNRDENEFLKSYFMDNDGTKQKFRML